jgi:toxin ParE1/3/4
MMPIIFHSEADQEVRDAVDWYDREATGVGAEFLDELGASARIVAAPEAFGILSDDVRCHRLHRFPYGILYQIQPDRVFVVAVMHLHREPDYWKDRV